MKLTSIAILLLICTNLNAATLSYTCEVTNVYGLNDDGSLKVSGFDKGMKGSKFSVSRVTGEIIGQVVPTIVANSTRVINKGSSENSFKTVAEFDEQFQILEVQEFRKGDSKPFVSSSMGGAGIVTGLCK
jgi:hypothetical protein|tara:strand:+ start:81 stop:470 length:390 start_codon:yes stop_codon:yes gene_type:complete